MRSKLMILGLFCLILAGCAERAPVPFPDSQTIATAHYGEYPENYEYLVSLNHTLPPSFRSDNVYAFRGVPEKTMLEHLGRYEFGWGGMVEVWYWVGNRDDDFMEKKLFQYLIRDGKLMLFEAQGR